MTSIITFYFFKIILKKKFKKYPLPNLKFYIKNIKFLLYFLIDNFNITTIKQIYFFYLFFILKYINKLGYGFKNNIF